MKIIAHHTCENKGEIKDIELNGAFLSTNIDGNITNQKLLGTGYYFFDNNITMAHAHGKNRYRRKYYIFEAELNLKEDDFLDLVGNRTDMIWIQDVKKRFEPHLKDNQKKLGAFIEFLKQKNSSKEFKGIFPYKAIRAIDNSVNTDKIKEDQKIHLEEVADESKMYFIEGKDKFINLQPIYTLCLLELDKSIFTSFKHIYTNV